MKPLFCSLTSHKGRRNELKKQHPGFYTMRRRHGVLGRPFLEGRQTQPGWWQLKYFLFSPRKLGEDFQFDSYFSEGLVQPPTSNRVDHTFDVRNPAHRQSIPLSSKVLYIPGGAGFLPSTVSLDLGCVYYFFRCF